MRVPLGTLFQSSSPEVHDAMINGEPVDCRVPDAVIQVFIERRVVMFPTFNAAVMIKDCIKYVRESRD